MENNNNTQSLKLSTVLPIATIFAFRMLGLFMILPVFALYAQELQYSTPLLMGIALGIYGLTQAGLQIPFGMLSDRIGRKPIIALGLLLFAAGSLLAGVSHSIYGVIAGRALQGTGAIGSTLIALLADLTPDTKRTHAMALLGMVIGSSFFIAMLLGPLLSHTIGVNGIFYLTAILSAIGLLLLYTLVPTPAHSGFHGDTDTSLSLIQTVVKQRELLRLDAGIFIQHAIFTASFTVIPLALKQSGLAIENWWMFYLPLLLGSFIVMLPFIILAEKKQKMKTIFLSAIGLIAIAQTMLWFQHNHFWELALGLFLFFTAFNFLEAALPSLISKRAPSGTKGTAMGVYSSSQFLGIFVGGTLGGWLYGHHHTQGVFLCGVVLAVIWFVIALKME